MTRLADFLANISDDLEDGEVLTDAVIIYRAERIENAGERVSYTTTVNTSFALARGMLTCVEDQLADMYLRSLQGDEDGS